MLVLFLLLFGGPRGAVPTFTPAWAASANRLVGPIVSEPQP